MIKNDPEGIWKDYSRRLQSDLNLNIAKLQEVNFGKTRNAVRKLFVRRLTESIVYLVLITLLLKFTINNLTVFEWMISGLVLNVFAVIGFVSSIRQMILISRLNYSGPVTTVQTEMEKLKAYNLQTLRLIFMSVPFYSAYIIIGFKVLFGINVIIQANPAWLYCNLCLSIVFIPFSVWLYRKLSCRTTSNWIKSLIRDSGGKEIHAAMQFLGEIEDYQK